MVPAPPFDLCVACAEHHLFRDATGILRTLQKEQPAHYHLNKSCIQVVATDFVPSSIVVPPDVLPSLGQVHKMNSCVSFLDSFILDMLLRLYFSVMNWPHAVCSPVHSKKLEVLKDSDEAIERGSSRKIANLIQSKNQSIVQSRGQVLHRPKTNTEADRWKLCQVARVTLTVPFETTHN